MSYGRMLLSIYSVVLLSCYLNLSSKIQYQFPNSGLILKRKPQKQLGVASLARFDRMVKIRRGFGQLEHAPGAKLGVKRNALLSSRRYFHLEMVKTYSLAGPQCSVSPE